MSLPSTSARGTLAAAALGFVVVLLDVSVVNVALDALRQEFATDVAGLQWVINAYTLVFAALLLTSGALGDRLGARRIFLAGFLVFTVASAACGLSGSLRMLIAARLVQGLGRHCWCRTRWPCCSRPFPIAQQQPRGGLVGRIWRRVAGRRPGAGRNAGDAYGLAQHFLINLPIGLIGIHLTLRHVAAHGGARRRGLDWAGQGAAILALAALTMALTEAARLGWTHGLVQGGLWAAAAAILGFIWIEARGRSPMLPLELFKVSTFAVASLAGVIVNFAYYGLIFVFSLFFQVQQQLSPQLTGLAFLPMTIVLMAVNVLAGRLITRLGARVLMVLGLALAAVGYGLLMPVSVEGSYWLLVVPMLMAASGIALMVPTMTNATLSSVDASRAGIASGVLNSARQVGGMLGVAVFGYLLRDTEPQAFMRGMHLSIGIAVALLLAASALCWFRLGTERAVA